MFPEGNIWTKKHENEIWEMKRGAIFFSRKLKLPLVPISLKGIEGIWPKEPMQRFPTLEGELTINVGKPILPRQEYTSKKLRQQIFELYNNL